MLTHIVALETEGSNCTLLELKEEFDMYMTAAADVLIVPYWN